jgi:DNA invertase Pin-like site-specific DNA recombinase
VKTAFSYIRFSSLQQSAGDSLRRQTSLAQAYCERRGLVLDTSLSLKDLGKSAYRGANASTGALSLFLEAIRTGKVKRGSHLIIESLDRLTRQDVDSAYDLFRSIIKSGVVIHTLQPERVHDARSIKDVLGIVEPLLIMSRGNEESEAKSRRVGQAWAAKRAAIGAVKLTSKAPCWLELSEDKRSFKLVPEKVATIRKIYRMRIAGAGPDKITRVLNAERVPVIGKAKSWERSWVTRILTSRSIVGEFEPHTLESGKRKSTGNVIAGYFPNAVSPKVYYAAQAAAAASKRPGRPSANCKNLFVGLLVDRHDGKNMHLVDKGRRSRLRLVSCGAIRGEDGSEYRSFDYARFERSILAWLVDVRPADLADGSVDDLAALESKHKAITDQIAKVQDQLTNVRDPALLIPSLNKLGEQREATENEIERCKRDRATSQPDNLHELKSAYEHLQEATDENRTEVRTKLKAIVARVVERVTMSVENGKAICEVVLRDQPPWWLCIRADGVSIATSERSLRRMIR